MLTLRTKINIRFRPLFQGLWILPEKTGSAAGRVNNDQIKIPFETSEILSIITGYPIIGVAPTDNILFEYSGACSNDFIRDQQRCFRKCSGQKRRFSSGCSAKVVYPWGIRQEIEQGSYGLIEEHGRGFLHVVCTRMEGRIQGKYRAFGKISSGGTPGHLFQVIPSSGILVGMYSH